MKKIFIFTMVMLLQNGFYNNIYGKSLIESYTNYGFSLNHQAHFLPTGIDANSELIEKLSKDKDFIKFYKYCFAGSLQKFSIEDNAKNGVVIPQDKVLLEEITNKSKDTYDRVLNKFPDFKDLDVNEKVIVLKKSFAMAAALTYAEITICVGGFIVSLGSCWSPTLLERGIFCACMGLSFGADMVVLWETAGTAAAQVTALAGQEVQFCATIAKNATTATCVVSAVATLVTCILTQAAD
jgi:hypothetical protein